MNTQEYDAWSKWMKSRRGTWTIDPIHNGIDRDLIAFLSDRQDETKGVFVCASGSTITAGKYADGAPVITDGEFQVLWGLSLLGGVKDDKHGCAKPTNAAMKLVIERLGVAFLLGAICDVPHVSCKR